MTANEAEMVALKMALERINTKCELNIYTENAFIANAVQNGWADQWKADGWKTKAGKDVANRKLWEELFPMLEKYTVRWHVKELYSYKNWLRDEVEKNRQFVAPVQPVGKDGNDNV
jgi:ribonuclease HI